jgi:hypothetical protein
MFRIFFKGPENIPRSILNYSERISGFSEPFLSSFEDFLVPSDANFKIARKASEKSNKSNQKTPSKQQTPKIQRLAKNSTQISHSDFLI